MSVYYPQWIASLSVVFDGFGGGETAPMLFDVIPRSFSVNSNGYKEADTFELEFDASALPFSPELIRSVGVSVYAWGAESVTADPRLGKTEDHLLVTGLADNAGLHLSDDGRSFRVDGRDYTCLMLDRQWDPTRRVRTGRGLDDVVQELVDEAAQADRTGFTLTVVWESQARIPVFGGYETKTNKRGVPVKDGKNYWDVIYSLCLRLGFIVFVRGFDVVIATPQDLVASASTSPRKVVYGRNLASLDVERHLGKEMVPQIEVRCYDSTERVTRVARFPKHKNTVTTGVGTKKDEVRVMTVHGITDLEALKRCAETAYNSIARSEGTVKWSTMDLTDLEDASLLTLRAGSPILIGWDPFNDDEMRRRTEEQRFGYLCELGYSETVARTVAQHYELINQFRVPFYSRGVTISGDVDSGISLEGEAVNFIAVGRDDASLQG